MQKWYHIFTKNTGLGLYTWIMFCILPFYFVFRLSSPLEITIGIMLIVLFFAAYRFAFVRKGWPVYLFLGIAMVISTVLTLYFGYVYFALFIAFFIGNCERKGAFITLYVLHLSLAVAAVSAGFFIQKEILLMQVPFLIVTILGVILLPLNMYHTNKRKKLEDELQNANERISELLVAEERQRIARDLHDTLGQKLSLIGLKSDLSSKLVDLHPNKARQEMKDINQTARNALKELREIVSSMKSMKLKDELVHVQQLLKAAGIEFKLEGNHHSLSIPLLVENVISMCLKEAVTNVVKHSRAKTCWVIINQTKEYIELIIKDDGIGIESQDLLKGNGLRGMRERLEFINGSMTVDSDEGTVVAVQVPRVIVQSKQEE